MKRVTGIGGLFFKAKDPKALQAWYEKHLGLPTTPVRIFPFFALLACSLFISCGKINPPVQVFKPSTLPLEKIKLPDGFHIEVFAEGVKNARSMALSPNGALFVGTRGEGKVYALRDTNGDFRADEVFTLAKGLKMPNGVAFHEGALYVAEVSRILRYDNIEANLANPPEPVVIYDQYPTETHHGWKFISFGPDGKLYVPVGAPCNICESEDEVFASITRLNPDGSGMEVVQHGIRNTVGLPGIHRPEHCGLPTMAATGWATTSPAANSTTLRRMACTSAFPTVIRATYLTLNSATTDPVASLHPQPRCSGRTWLRWA